MCHPPPPPPIHFPPPSRLREQAHQQTPDFNTKGVDHGPPQNLKSVGNRMMDSRHRDHGMYESRKN